MFARSSTSLRSACVVPFLLLACGASTSTPPSGALPSHSALSDAGSNEGPKDASLDASEPKHQLTVNLDSHFALRERTATAAIIAEQDKNRLLEIHKFEGAGCSDELVPKIGPLTAITRTEVEKKGELEFRWFTQRSTLEHTPFVGVGFYLCTNWSFILVRYVGPEAAMDSAKNALQLLMANRNIVIE